MFDMEFGDDNNNSVPEPKKYSSAARKDTDIRTSLCEIFPGGLENWEFELGVRASCPAILQRRSRRREIARTKPGKLFAALAHKKDSSAAFIVDSRAFKAQVPESFKHKLRNVTTIKAIPLLTAGDVHPTCTEVGYMDFTLPGRDEIYTVECLVRPGHSDICLFALDDFEALEPPEGGDDPEQAVQVMFKKNYIRFGKKEIPLFRIDGMPMIIPEVVSGSNSKVLGSKVRVSAPAGCAETENCANWQYVHRILGHASQRYCERTAQKAVVLPKILKQPPRPCPECALGKMKAPSKGRGELSTGLPEPTGPGMQFSVDTFGPFWYLG